MTTILTRYDTDPLSYSLQELSIARGEDTAAQLRSLLYSDCKDTRDARLSRALETLKRVENRQIACTDVADVLEALPQYISDCSQTTLKATSLFDELCLMVWDYANVPELSKCVERIIRALRTLEYCLDKGKGSFTSLVAQHEIPLLVKRMNALVPEIQGQRITIELIRQKVLEKNELFLSINKYSRHLTQAYQIKYRTDLQSLAQITLSEQPEELHLRVIGGQIYVHTASKLRTIRPTHSVSH